MTDPDERRQMRQRITQLNAEMKQLKEAKKVKHDMVENSKKYLRHKKNIERKQKQELGKNDRAVLQSVERVLRAHSIEKPYYHGGLYNGKAMNRLMTCSQTLMHDIQNVLLDAPVHATRCSDDEIISWAEKFANILKVFDEVFSISRTPSGQLTEEQGRILMLRVEESLRLWRGLSLNVTPKVHAVEDHLCQQVCRLNGIGD